MTGLAWRLTRLGGRRALLSTGLTVIAVAVATLLLQFAVAGNFAFAERAERTEWRSPDAVPGGAAVIATAVDYYGGDAITRVDLAQTAAEPQAPPGLDAFPAPGEVWLSPALADLLDGVADEDFLARYGGAVTGQIGDEALSHQSELLAVVGRDAGDPTMSAERNGVDNLSPRPIDGFDGEPDSMSIFYRVLMFLATILMVVPVVVFGAAAARLTVARRDERLAAMRLVGATPGQVVRLTLAETAMAAAAGSVAGTLLWLASTPLVALIPIDGGRWYVADLWAGAPWTAVVAAAVPVLVSISALIGLRSVVISPLGVAKRVRPKGLRAIRMVVFAALSILFVAASQTVGGDALGIAILLVFLTGAIAAVNLAGPWVVQKLGNLLARTASDPSRMLASRRLSDDPKAAWRTVAGVVLAGFVAGAVAMFPMIKSNAEPGTTETIGAEVPADQAEDLAAGVSGELDGLAEVTVEDQIDYLGGGVDLSVVVATASGADLETVRSVMTASLPGDPPEREVDASLESNQVTDSVRVGVTVVLAVVFATAAVSAGVSAVGSVLDRRTTYRLLHLSGTPQRVLDSARRQETLLPLAILGGASILLGMGMTAPMIFIGFNLSGTAILLATLTVGTVAVLAAGSASRPLLTATMNDVSPRPD